MNAVEQLRVKLLALGDLTVTYTPITKLHKATIKIEGCSYSTESLSESDALYDLLKKVSWYQGQATLKDAVEALRETKR